MTSKTTSIVLITLGAITTFPFILIGLFVPVIVYIGALMTLILGIWAYVEGKKTSRQALQFNTKTAYSQGLNNSVLAFAILTPLILIVGIIMFLCGGIGIGYLHQSWEMLAASGVALAGAVLCSFGTLLFSFIFYILYLVQTVQVKKTVSRLSVQQPQVQPPTATAQDFVVAYPSYEKVEEKI